MKKIIFVNILILIFVVALFEVIGFCKYYFGRYSYIFEKAKNNGLHLDICYKIPIEFSSDNYPYTSYLKFEDFKKNSTKRPLCFVGCSYTDGASLETNETFAYKISQLTNRTVYLRGIAGTGLSYVYYQIANKLIPQDVEYIVYTYIQDHQLRLFQYQIFVYDPQMNLRYKIGKNGKPERIKNKFLFLNASFFVKYLQDEFAFIKLRKELGTYSLFKAIMTDLTEQMKKNYPNAKFVFLAYPESNSPTEQIPQEITDFVKSLDCIYLDAGELSGEDLGDVKWKIKGEGLHPSSEAWDKVAPAFIKALNL